MCVIVCYEMCGSNFDSLYILIEVAKEYDGCICIGGDADDEQMTRALNNVKYANLGERVKVEKLNVSGNHPTYTH